MPTMRPVGEPLEACGIPSGLSPSTTRGLLDAAGGDVAATALAGCLWRLRTDLVAAGLGVGITVALAAGVLRVTWWCCRGLVECTGDGVGVGVGPLARTDAGLNDGCPCCPPPTVEPYTQASTLPGLGCADMAPSSVNDQLFAAASACQYDHDAEVGGVRAQDC
jgi:hypothetical protein